MVILWFGALAQSGNPFDIKRSNRSTVAPLSTANVIYSDSDTVSYDQIGIENRLSGGNPFDIGANKKSTAIAQGKKEANTQPSSAYSKKKSAGVNKGIMAIFCFLNLVLIAFAFSTNRGRFVSVINSTYNSNTLKNLFRSAKSWFDLQGTLLYVAFILSTSLYIFLLTKNGWFGSVVLSWWHIPLVLIGLYATRHLFMAFFAYIFPLGNSIEIQNYSIGLHNMISSLVLLPVALGMTFGPEGSFGLFAIIGLILIGIIYFLRQAKGFLMVITMRGFNPIYFFIYLCAVEIAPFLILSRLVSSGI